MGPSQAALLLALANHVEARRGSRPGRKANLQRRALAGRVLGVGQASCLAAGPHPKEVVPCPVLLGRPCLAEGPSQAVTAPRLAVAARRLVATPFLGGEPNREAAS